MFSNMKEEMKGLSNEDKQLGIGPLEIFEYKSEQKEKV
jgi:hypothetical protein